MNSLEPLYLIPEAAQYLRISRTTAYRLIKSGNLGTIRIGNKVRVKESQLKRLIDDC